MVIIKQFYVGILDECDPYRSLSEVLIFVKVGISAVIITVFTIDGSVS